MTTIYTINQAGIHQVERFVSEHGKDGLNAEAYLADAEMAANDAFDREIAAVIEIGRAMSWDGKPHTLVLEQAWFDADVAE
jgi:hypothetical protein